MGLGALDSWSYDLNFKVAFQPKTLDPHPSTRDCVNAPSVWCGSAALLSQGITVTVSSR